MGVSIGVSKTHTHTRRDMNRAEKALSTKKTTTTSIYDMFIIILIIKNVMDKWTTQYNIHRSKWTL